MGDVSVGYSYLDETNVGALLAEALTADVEAVLADETSGVGADAAVSTVLAFVLAMPYAFSNPYLRSFSQTLRCQQGAHPPESYIGVDLPLAGALAVVPRARIPDRLVRHDVWFGVGICGCRLLLQISILLLQ
jgi:hypothetical protein